MAEGLFIRSHLCWWWANRASEERDKLEENFVVVARMYFFISCIQQFERTLYNDMASILFYHGERREPEEIQSLRWLKWLRSNTMRSERAQLPTKLLCSFHILLINTIIAIVTNVPISKIVTIVTIVTITQLPTAYACIPFVVSWKWQGYG